MPQRPVDDDEEEEDDDDQDEDDDSDDCGDHDGVDDDDSDDDSEWMKDFFIDKRYFHQLNLNEHTWLCINNHLSLPFQVHLQVDLW